MLTVRPFLASIFLPLLVSSAPIGSNLTCAGLLYDSKRYTCLATSTGSEPFVLCPVHAPLLCNNACYSPDEYVCSGSPDAQSLTPPQQTSGTPYSVAASLSGSDIDTLLFQAGNDHFYIGMQWPLTYCPRREYPCTNTTETTFQDGELAVRVPGGQQLFTDSDNGVLTFTSPHSRYDFNSTSPTTEDAYGIDADGHFYGPHGTAWRACPVANAVNTWQVYADLGQNASGSWNATTDACIDMLALAIPDTSDVNLPWAYI